MIKVSQQQGELPYPSPPPRPAGQAPAQRKFAAETVTRIPVQASEIAHAFLVASTSEGRLFPQALGEALALVEGVAGVEIDLVAKRQHFALHPSEIDPATGYEPHLLVITLHPVEPTAPTRRALINAEALNRLHLGPQGTHLPVFRAIATAQEIARLHPTLPTV